MKGAPTFVPPRLTLEEVNAFSARMRADQRGYRRLASLLERVAGIHLPSSEKNLSLMAGRVGPLLRERGLETYDAYADLLAQSGPAELKAFVSALTTNTTEFFREAAHFEHLAKNLPELLGHRSELRIWCAACSSGQEVWTTLITVRETLGERMPMVKFLATDVDLEILQKAASGRYTEHEVESLPALYRQKYFAHHSSRGIWEVGTDLTFGVTFAPFNLMQESYLFQHRFDVVFCRNVLIYFDRPTVDKVLKRLSGTLRPGGLLYLGHSEAGTLRSESMTSVAPAVYRRKG